MPIQQPANIVIGVIVKAHGLKGEVKVKPITDDPQRYRQLKSVIIEPRDGENFTLSISKVSLRGDFVYLFFEEVHSREKAEKLHGAFVCIKREDVLPLDEEHFYHFEIIGFTVKTFSGQILGTVREVMDLPANAVLVVQKDAQEYLIPVIKDVVRKIDKAASEIIIEPVEGLLD
ncbi:MAG: ribosome maturation factor RimM [bacterium]